MVLTWLRRSAGVTVLNNFNGVILHSESDPNGHFVILILNVNNNIIRLASLYGYNSKPEDDFLFDALESGFLHGLSKYPKALLFVGGDFNIALNGSNLTLTQVLAILLPLIQLHSCKNFIW